MNLISLYLTLGGSAVGIGFFIWFILGVIALAITPKVTSPPDPDYQKKLDRSNNLGSVAKLFGWICLFGIITVIVGGSIEAFVNRRMN